MAVLVAFGAFVLLAAVSSLAAAGTGTVATVARANGLKIYGEALESGRPSLGDDMAMRRHADFPMAAMWTHTERGRYAVSLQGGAARASIQLLTRAGDGWTSLPLYWLH